MSFLHAVKSSSLSRIVSFILVPRLPSCLCRVLHFSRVWVYYALALWAFDCLVEYGLFGILFKFFLFIIF